MHPTRAVRTFSLKSLQCMIYNSIGIHKNETKENTVIAEKWNPINNVEWTWEKKNISEKWNTIYNWELTRIIQQLQCICNSYAHTHTHTHTHTHIHKIKSRLKYYTYWHFSTANSEISMWSRKYRVVISFTITIITITTIITTITITTICLVCPDKHTPNMICSASPNTTLYTQATKCTWKVNYCLWLNQILHYIYIPK